MKSTFLITITTLQGTVNTWAERETDARIVCVLVSQQAAVTRVQVHRTDAAGLIVGTLLDEQFSELREGVSP